MCATKFGGHSFSGFGDIATIIFCQISLLNNVLSLLSQAPSIKFLLTSHQKLAKANFLILHLHFTLNLFMLNLSQESSIRFLIKLQIFPLYFMYFFRFLMPTF